MCGIAGLLSLSEPIKHEQIARMIGTLSHRGPDDEGIYLSSQPVGVAIRPPGASTAPYVGLGHSRLSIIDISTGHQPIHNETNDIWIVYNGETYNFREQQKKLIRKNHAFYTNTDTEVIIHLYEEYGENCVKYLRGMFSFAIWDEKEKKIFIARDRLGKKPLYYYWDKESFIFGSELKAILASPSFSRKINLTGLINYLQLGYIPSPSSIFKGVSKLPAGHSLSIKNGKLTVKNYWEHDFTLRPVGSDEEIERELMERLRESVRLRLMSDVPLGAFLSGGIDSGTIVALMAQEMTQPVKTFSIGYEEPEYNELPYARMVSKRYNTDHHEMIVKPESFDLVEGIIKHFDEPFGDSSSIPTYYVSKMASQHVKVVLSGDGGDELFAGYDSYTTVMGRSKYEQIPMQVRKMMRIFSEMLPYSAYGKNFLYNISLSYNQRFIEYVTHISSRHHFGLLSSDIKNEVRPDPSLLQRYFEEVKLYDPVSQMQYVDFKTYLPEDILVKVDRMSMAHSLEARSPFLDHQFVEFVNSLSSKSKLNGHRRKVVLKKIASKLLPAEVMNKKKQGFAVPLKYWFKSDLNDYMHQILFEPKTIQRGYFNKKYIQALVAEHERGRRDNSKLLWHLVVFEIWHRLCLDHG